MYLDQVSAPCAQKTHVDLMLRGLFSACYEGDKAPNMYMDTNKLAYWKSRFTLPGDTANDVYLLPVSGGADSSALAIVMHTLYPEISWVMLFSDTGAEAQDVYDALDKLEDFLGKKIERITSGETLWTLIEKWGGFLPSSQARYCTPQLKKVPFVNWIERYKGQSKHMFIGIRADEKQRLAFTLDEVSTSMPMIDMGLAREDVFSILSSTIGIPAFYQRRTRSGCSVCPFQRRSEISMLFLDKPVEFHRGASYEKINASDLARQAPAPDLCMETGIARNWMSLPMPADGEEITGICGVKGDTIFGDQGIWIGAEIFIDGMPGMGSFIFHQKVVSYSTTLAGIKRQIQSRYEHLLNTAEVWQMTAAEVRNQVKFVVYFIEVSASVFDINGPAKGSYTWHQGTSYRQIEHIIGWATRVLHAAALDEEARNGAEARITSWKWEVANESRKGLERVTQETGRVVRRGWFKAKEPVANDEEFDERTIPCPMCHI
jgi:3'-phosphoadenosine 5'-phosphosulfate sulfotransferase (PAPS reductase)/FAD synthetase